MPKEISCSAEILIRMVYTVDEAQRDLIYVCVGRWG